MLESFDQFFAGDDRHVAVFLEKSQEALESQHPSSCRSEAHDAGARIARTGDFVQAMWEDLWEKEQGNQPAQCSKPTDIGETHS